MIDWTKSMRQTFEYYIVEPYTWFDIEQLTAIKSCSITRDLTLDTLGSASIESSDDLNDKYVRVYLIATQGDEKEKIPLGTFLAQSPSTSFDGKVHAVSHDAYTPLIELTEKPMAMGFAVRKGENVVRRARGILLDYSLRAPVGDCEDATTLTGDFLSDPSDTRLTFVSDLLSNAKYSLGLDELGRLIFEPYKDLNALQPRWIYTDDNSSILYPELSASRDIFGVPNKVEVVFSSSKGDFLTSTEVNDDETSIVSYQARGRWIVRRDSSPDVVDGINQEQLDAYAHKKLVDLSSVDFELSYRHGYCPVRLGDCVMLNYRRADVRNTKAKVIKQVIDCIPGCPVQETAVFTKKLYGGDIFGETIRQAG